MKYIYIILTFFLTTTYACTNEDYSPKPRAFHRIEFPTKAYVASSTGCPFTFEIPTYSNLEDDRDKNANPCWKNLDFPQYNATLHLSYYDIIDRHNFDQLTEDARTFVFKHSTKATAIDQKSIKNPEHHIYGLEYFIQGNTASNYQFYVSDSTKHYLRGALYFNEKPNLDSIQPVLEFLKNDIEHLIQTIRWK